VRSILLLRVKIILKVISLNFTAALNAEIDERLRWKTYMTAAILMILAATE